MYFQNSTAFLEEMIVLKVLPFPRKGNVKRKYRKGMIVLKVLSSFHESTEVSFPQDNFLKRFPSLKRIIETSSVCITIFINLSLFLLHSGENPYYVRLLGSCYRLGLAKDGPASYYKLGCTLPFFI